MPGWQSIRWGMQSMEIIAAVGSKNLKIAPRDYMALSIRRYRFPRSKSASTLSTSFFRWMEMIA
ncbi:hypothetical protein [Bradyrhizobium sp. USDA 4473]